MSEWGNPAGVMPGHRGGEHIASARRTRGTETSQYLEEEETTVILLVAASERGAAQTMGAEKAAAVASVGLEGGSGGACRPFGSHVIEAEPGWKAGPEGVTVP